MPLPCTVCRHPDAVAINGALVAQEPYRHIAQRTGTTPSALIRHKRGHLPVMLTRAVREAEVVQATTLLEQVQVLQRETLQILGMAKAAGDLRTALFAIGQARMNLELQARLLEAQREEADGDPRLAAAVDKATKLSREIEERGLATLTADAEAANELREAAVMLLGLADRPPAGNDCQSRHRVLPE